MTLLDRRNHHLFQPLLYQVATGMLSPVRSRRRCATSCATNRRSRSSWPRSTGFDLERRVVPRPAPDGGPFEVPYDSLIVAAGAGQSYFGHDEFALFAPGHEDDRRRARVAPTHLRRVRDGESATDRRPNVAVAHDGRRRRGPDRRGARGPDPRAGVRHACAASSARSTLRRVRVVLVDAGKEPLATFGDRLSDERARHLGSLGVELHDGERASSASTPTGSTCERDDGTRRASRRGTVIWAAGVQASPLAAALAEATGAPSSTAPDASRCCPTSRCPGHPEVFAVGDMVSLDNLPGVAEVAMQGGPARRQHHRAPPARRATAARSAIAIWAASPPSGGSVRSCSFRGIRLSGFPGWLVWMFVHLAFLNGFANRFSTLWSWVRSMVGTARASGSSAWRTPGRPQRARRGAHRMEPNPFPEMDAGPSADS